MHAHKRYGTPKHPWHPEFVRYIEEIAAHPSYSGMPDAYRDDGLVQWEAPSNRSAGRYQHTHQRRRDWWQRKAAELGIDTNTKEWISRAAKTLHPTKKKPCKRCGRVMDIRYAYPSARLLGKIGRLRFINDAYVPDRLDRIIDIVKKLVEVYGDESLDSLTELLLSGTIRPPDVGRDLERWINWIDAEYIPSEPRGLLSPGAMSNAPDRFDGFHSFNLCCRKSADTGRHTGNLQTYVTDRRVFEFWNDGDWIAADKLMGVIRSRFQEKPCANAHPGPCSADHVGPLSLGFAHVPFFRMLCLACNSAKNNRLDLRDVQTLLAHEESGTSVMTWYGRKVWDLRKHDVVDDETALRLSKVLRDNQRLSMSVLVRLGKTGHWTFLTTLLNLSCADYVVTFDDVEITTQGVVEPTRERRKARTTKYAAEQKARRLRIGLKALVTYATKDNRHDRIRLTDPAKKRLEALTRLLREKDQNIRALDKEIERAVWTSNHLQDDTSFRWLAERLTPDQNGLFRRARQLLDVVMESVGVGLAAQWTDDRYVRVGDAADGDS